MDKKERIQKKEDIIGNIEEIPVVGGGFLMGSNREKVGFLSSFP